MAYGRWQTGIYMLSGCWMNECVYYSVSKPKCLLKKRLWAYKIISLLHTLTLPFCAITHIHIHTHSHTKPKYMRNHNHFYSRPFYIATRTIIASNHDNNLINCSGKYVMKLSGAIVFMHQRVKFIMIFTHTIQHKSIDS